MEKIKNILKCIKAANMKLLVVFILTLFVTFSGSAISNTAHAQTAQCTIDNSTLEDTKEFRIKANNLIMTIIEKVNAKLLLISQQMFVKITANTAFFGAIFYAICLFLAVYGVLFVTGMAQIKLYDFMIILIKIAIIFMMFSPASWAFFNDKVIYFFNEGSTELINYFTQTGDIKPFIANTPGLGPATANATTGIMAFKAIDNAINMIISSKMFVILGAAAASDNYGLLMGALMCYGIWLALMSMITALWVYVMSLIMKTLLFGLAPIFIPTILFKRTRHLFDNWLNQIVSATLQPVLLFIFFVFFVKLMESSLDNILAYPVCWTQLPDAQRGSPLNWYFWRFAEYKGGTAGWVPNTAPQKDFPIPIIHILNFLIIAELANRFNKVVVQIAMQISQASVSLAHEGAGMFSSFTMAARRAKGIAD